jgi:hypothetical protein
LVSAVAGIIRRAFVFGEEKLHPVAKGAIRMRFPLFGIDWLAEFLIHIFLEEFMKGSLKASEVRVELKYCEHCGALWIREGGAGVYCDKCQPTVADLPEPKRKPGRRSTLPVRTRTSVDDLKCEALDECVAGFESAGGVA